MFKFIISVIKRQWQMKMLNCLLIIFPLILSILFVDWFLQQPLHALLSCMTLRYSNTSTTMTYKKTKWCKFLTCHFSKMENISTSTFILILKFLFGILLLINIWPEYFLRPLLPIQMWIVELLQRKSAMCFWHSAETQYIGIIHSRYGGMMY